MAIDYTIAAIPTVYRGRRYRSRLEAKWAAFFDRLGWRAEYEPYDLGKWSPDFLLTGTWPSGHVNHVMVEVKPIARWDMETAIKMHDTLQSLHEDDERGSHQLLLVGTSPLLHKSGVQLGWGVDSEWDDDGEAIGVADRRADFKIFANHTGLVVDFSEETYPIGGSLTGLSSLFEPHHLGWYRADLLEIPHEVKTHSEWLMGEWTEACNAVQWRPK